MLCKESRFLDDHWEAMITGRAQKLLSCHPDQQRYLMALGKLLVLQSTPDRIVVPGSDCRNEKEYPTKY